MRHVTKRFINWKKNKMTNISKVTKEGSYDIYIILCKMVTWPSILHVVAMGCDGQDLR